MDKKPCSSKRQRVPVSGHVGIVCHSTDDEKHDEYQIYFVDLDSCADGSGSSSGVTHTIGGYSHIVPTVRFDGCFIPRAICVLDSTLYVFEGYQGCCPVPEYRGKSVVKFELSSEVLASNYKLEDWELDRVCDMHYSKYRPEAIPTPDGKKILVFSTRLNVEEADTHFELYDPWSDSWEKLPGLSSQYQLYYDVYTTIAACSFVDESLFFIQTELGMFVLDLQSVDKGWYFCGDPCVPWKGGYFLTINNEFLFTPSVIYDVREVGLSRNGFPFSWGGGFSGQYIFPLSSFPPPSTPMDLDELQADFPSITLLHHDIDIGVVHCCILQSERVLTTDTSDYTRLLIDVCATDLGKLNMRIIRSLQLLIDHHPRLVSVQLFSI